MYILSHKAERLYDRRTDGKMPKSQSKTWLNYQEQQKLLNNVEGGRLMCGSWSLYVNTDSDLGWLWTIEELDEKGDTIGRSVREEEYAEMGGLEAVNWLKSHSKTSVLKFIPWS